MRRYISVASVSGALLLAASPAFAASPDLVTTTPTTIVNFTGTGWDATRAFFPAVVDTGNGYVMLFAGEPFANNIQIGLATSPDNGAWTVNPASPVISNANSPSWASFRETPQTLLYENGTYKVWFNGNNSNLFTDPGNINGFGYATSTDAIHWSIDPNPIRASHTGFNLVSVVHLNGTYYAYYVDSTNTLYLATSSDGVTFSGDTPLNGPTGYYLSTATLDLSGGQKSILAIWEAIGSGGQYYGRSIDGQNFTVDGKLQTSPDFYVEDVLAENGTLDLYGAGPGGIPNWSYGNAAVQSATAADPYAAEVPEPASLILLGAGLFATTVVKLRGRARVA